MPRFLLKQIFDRPGNVSCLKPLPDRWWARWCHEERTFCNLRQLRRRRLCIMLGQSTWIWSQCHSLLNFHVGSYIQSVDTGCGRPPLHNRTQAWLPRNETQIFPPFACFVFSFFSYLTFQRLALPPESSIATAYGGQAGPSDERIWFL